MCINYSTKKMSIVTCDECLPVASTKYCKRCDRTLSVTDFYKDKSSPDGYNSICKSCKYNTDKERNTIIRAPNGEPCELSLTELKLLVRQHGITGTSYMNKADIIEVLKQHGVLPENYYAGIRRNKTFCSQNGSEPVMNKQAPKQVRSLSVPKSAELTLLDSTYHPTDTKHSFPSIYKSAKFMGTYSSTITNHNGCTYRSNVDGKVYQIYINDQ